MLSNSFLKPIFEYRVEMYSMEFLNHAATASVELKIFRDGIYSAEYEITRADEKTTSGVCMNRPTKEATIEAVEEAAIRALEGEERYWE